MSKPDQAFKQVYDWFRTTITHALSALPDPQRVDAERLVWQMLGVLDADAPPIDPDLSDFAPNGAHAESLSFAVGVIGEALTALNCMRQAVDAMEGGNPTAALAMLDPVLQQMEGFATQPKLGYPSAFSLGKILLMLSGDTEASPVAGQEAARLADLTGATTAPQIRDTQAALGLLVVVAGSLLDCSFTAPSTGDAALGFAGGLPALPPLPVKIDFATLDLPPQIGGVIEICTSAPIGVKAGLNLSLKNIKSNDIAGFAIELTTTPGVDVFVPVAPRGQVQVSSDFNLDMSFVRSKDDGTLVIGPFGGVELRIGELGVGLSLINSAPKLSFFARESKARFIPDDSFLPQVLGKDVRLDFALEANADHLGRLRLKNGTGLTASLPIPTLPAGPFKLELINLGFAPVDGSFLHLQTEFSASFGVELGPFEAVVDRMGMLVDLQVGGKPPPHFSFKRPNGIGLSLDAGVVKGGGYLAVDATGYAGTLELKLLAIDVKAICVLSTTETGYSLLLLIYGEFPPVQLSFGFTLTGIGGLIGVQHTTNITALSQGISNGALDAVLFPTNPVGDAPKIISTLRTLFPVKPGGFVIGPMLELGWGTPSLLTVRLGLLVEANQFVLLGQGIVQLPPLVSADLSLLYLRLDFVGSVTFEPLRIGFDAKLVNSHVAFISITGQFAFRAAFGDHPTFLISAGGFHPKFKEVPSDIPSPFDRVGASYDIGIIGVSFKGYFAITSATVQAGSDLRVWADIGIASIEGGFGFDAICYLEPRFYFEFDLHAYLAIHVFGQDFSSINLDGLLAGPGRWHIVGRAEVHTPWPLPDFSLHIDEAWGTDRDTPVVAVRIADKLALEIAKQGNWSAQLPQGGDGFLTLARVDPGTALLAHPLGGLEFRQKLVPLNLRLQKASGSKIDGPNEFGAGSLQLARGDNAGPPSRLPEALPDTFAAAQFLELSQDDKLAKPSFESYTAGYALRDDDFVLGEIVEETLDYEEVDLGAKRGPRKLRRIGSMAFSDQFHGVLMRFGAAGLSPLRDKAFVQPPQIAPVRVDPAPMAVTSKVTLELTAAKTYSSVWQADQAYRFDMALDPRQHQAVEMAEIAEAA
ncbi:DUF6603 domain-containing protein [Paraburkholderia sp. NPDC080076]|uniref:DUF6603 domain-containing protein n=1 Tax=Paraburkholderia sp. NPDC080076 TaxID=3390605 RepID=UPI003CFF5AD9